MKTVQLQKQIIIELTRKKPVRWFISRYEGNTALTDGHRVHLINDEDLFINPKRLEEWSTDSLKVIIGDHSKGAVGELTYISSHRVEGYDLYSGDGFEIAINPIYLKYFEEYELKGTGEYEVVYVYEQGELVGVVAPMRRGK